MSEPDIELGPEVQKKCKSKSPEHKSRKSSKRKHENTSTVEDDTTDEYPRYYGEDRPNSDSYWNKYPRKDNVKIGQRYYEPVSEDDKVKEPPKNVDDYPRKDNIKIGQRYYEPISKEAKVKETSKNVDKYPRKDNIKIGERYYEPISEDDKVKGNSKNVDDGRIKNDPPIVERKRKTVDMLTSRTGGAYIPPAKLRMMQASITDKSSVAYQRIAWEALKKSVHGYINKVNTSNIGIIAREVLHENIVRGRGLLCKSVIQAQAASPTFTNVYAALVAIINSKFPNIGELLLKRLVLQFKRGYKQNNKAICISATTFVAHLVNQRVAHEILALEILTLLVETPTDDSVEVSISFLKECGQKLTEVSSRGITAIFEMLRNILHEGQLEKRIQYMIEVMFQIRKDGFKDHAAVTEELDLVEEEDQFTHLIMLDDVKEANAEDILNVFKFDENYEENEGKYKTLSKEILGSDSESEDGSEESEEELEEGEGEDEEKAGTIIDNTETNLIALRRTIYLTIQSSLDFEECAHKLLKMDLKPGQEIELCHMFLDCCAEQRTYEKFYGLLAQRFCQINKIYIEPFQQIFRDTYSTTHRLDANRLRNVSKFFAHLLFTDAIGWEVLEIMKLNEEDTNSSSRIFIKILFQELAEYMGLGKLNARLKDETLHEYFAGLFPRDNPKNTRFSINFFTSIGLGGLTDELREHLKNIPKMVELKMAAGKESEESSSSGSSSEEDSSDEDDSDDSSSSEEKVKLKKTPSASKHSSAKSNSNRVEEDKRRPHKDDESDRRRKEEQHRSASNSSRSLKAHNRDGETRKKDYSRESDYRRNESDKDRKKMHGHEELREGRKDNSRSRNRYEDNANQKRNDKNSVEKSSKRRERSRQRAQVKGDRRHRSRERRRS